MPLPSLSVLIYTPGKPGASSRLVDVGESLAPPAGRISHGSYHVKRLAPSMRLLTWRREGANFDFSRTGAVRVWQGRQLAASDCALECRSQGVPPLEQDDADYLEAYLLSQNRSWNEPHAPKDISP